MNMSTSECSSGCESGWTTYLDQSSNSADQYPKATNDKNDQWSRGVVNVNEEDDEDEDLSMVSDASSAPRNDADRAYFVQSFSKQVNKHMKKNKNINDNRAYCLDDTASSPAFSFYKASYIKQSSPVSISFWFCFLFVFFNFLCILFVGFSEEFGSF